MRVIDRSNVNPGKVAVSVLESPGFSDIAEDLSGGNSFVIACWSELWRISATPNYDEQQGKDRAFHARRE
jgi:hypothetical protein